MSCSKKDSLPLVSGLSIVYFDMPKINLGSASAKLDSIDFSFAFEDKNSTHRKIAIPIKVIGSTSLTSRNVKFEIDWSSTSLDSNSFHISKINISNDQVSDSLYVEIIRKPDLKNKIETLTINLLENEHFKVWSPTKSKIRFYITDQLLQPNWWNTWSKYFGTYYPEIYEQWINIYIPGLDPTPPLEYLQKPNFGWNNMPFTPVEREYAITFFYIDVLKKYFDRNIVYPNNDSSKTPIKLP